MEATYKPARPTLGLMVGRLNYFESRLWLGAADLAVERDVNLLCFVGGYLGVQPVIRGYNVYEYQRNRLYDLISPERLDGLLVMSGAVGQLLSAEEFKRFLARYQPLPLISLGMELRGYPSIVVDNYQGMRDLIQHLIQDHRYRRIACLRGPEGNQEYDERYRAYVDLLSAHGLPLDPELVFVTDNMGRSEGSRAIGVLLDERQARFEVLVAANDAQALGALEALHARGLKASESIAIVGCDNGDESAWSTPPLTTIQYPTYEMGWRAAELLLAQLRGEAIPERTALPMSTLVRQSCGCFSKAALQVVAGSPPALSSSDRLEQTFTPASPQSRPQLLVAMAQDLGADAAYHPPAFAPEWVEQFVNAFWSELTAESPPNSFLTALDKILGQALTAKGELTAWHGVLSALRRHVLPGLLERQALLHAEDLCEQARVLIGEIIERTRAYQTILADRQAWILRGVGQELISTIEVAELMNVMAEMLPGLGIESCYLALYEPPATRLERSRLVLAYTNRQRVELNGQAIDFPSHQLTPRELLPQDRRYTLTVTPLFFREDQIGVALFEVGPRDGNVYEALRDQISGSLKASLLVQEVVDREKERERLLADQEKRAQELEQAYAALQENQQKLLTAEKLASLGRLTAGIAHEMNTPLAAVRAALAELTGLAQEYEAAFGDPAVTVEDYREITREIRQAIQLAERSAGQAADFVRGIKSQTRNLTPQALEPFEAVPVIRETLLLLGYALRQGKCTTRFEPEAEKIQLYGSSGRFAQVVTNLVVNSIEAYAGKGGGLISVRLLNRSGKIELQVSDRGNGILPEVLPKIFDPMFTTKPFGQGTGLGLTIMHDIVTSDFAGKIEVISQPGQGTTFTLWFPNQVTRDE